MMKNMNRWKWATLALTLAVVILSPLTFIYSQNLATLRTILNDVWDRDNQRIMTTSWAGAQGTFETEITIFNDVWDKDNHLLRTSSGEGGGSPGGSNTQVQYNDSGSFGGDAGLTFNKTTNVLTATGGFVGALTGNADTATALAANPTDCGAGEFANAIAANGNLTCAVPAGGGTITAVWTDSSGDVSALTAASGDTIDATLADSTKPVKAGTTPPGTCTADKDLFIDTDTTPAASLLVCNPTGDGWVYAVPVGVPDPGSNGLVARINSTPNTAARTITGTSNVITVTNGDGVSGNPTINTGANVPTLAPTDDNAIIGNGSAWQLKALPDCDDTGGNHLNYDTATNAFICGTSGAAGTGYATVQDEGTPLTARGTLNFVGAGVSCVDDTTRTNCTISGGGGGSSLSYTSGSDADTTMAVNTVYVTDMSSWATADRTYALPTSCAAGDRIGILITAGDASHELLITAAASDTLNGVAGGTEWSRLFITNEYVEMTCITANSAWQVTVDKRIPQKGLMRLSTSSDGNAACNTFSRPTQTSTAGAWTSVTDVGDVVSTTLDRITVRRTGHYTVAIAGGAVDALTNTQYVLVVATLNGTSALWLYNAAAASTSTSTGLVQAQKMTQAAPLNTDDYLVFQYCTSAANLGLLAHGSVTEWTSFSLTEVLP